MLTILHLVYSKLICALFPPHSHQKGRYALKTAAVSVFKTMLYPTGET